MLIVAYIKEDSGIKLYTNPEVTLMTAEKLSVQSAAIVAVTTKTSGYNANSVENPPDVILHCRKLPAPTKSMLNDFIECFSVRNNLSQLLVGQKTANAVPIIDGLKYGCA